MTLMLLNVVHRVHEHTDMNYEMRGTIDSSVWTSRGKIHTGNNESQYENSWIKQNCSFCVWERPWSDSKKSNTQRRTHNYMFEKFRGEHTMSSQDWYEGRLNNGTLKVIKYTFLRHLMDMKITSRPYRCLTIIQPAICVAVYVSHVLDRQLLNGWCHGHGNCRVCSRTRSHDSVICSYFRIHIFLVTASLVKVIAIAAADNLGQRGQSIILR